MRGTVVMATYNSAGSIQAVLAEVSADPVAFLLVSTGRRSQWTGVVRGQLVAWGRRPWLAMKLPRLLQTP